MNLLSMLAYIDTRVTEGHCPCKYRGGSMGGKALICRRQ